MKTCCTRELSLTTENPELELWSFEGATLESHFKTPLRYSVHILSGTIGTNMSSDSIDLTCNETIEELEQAFDAENERHEETPRENVPREQPLYFWCFTVSLPIAMRTLTGIAEFRDEKVRTALEKVIRSVADKFVYQLECTKENNFHYQGYLHCQPKIRKRTLIKAFLAFPYVAYFSPCHDERALKQYCMKTDSRVAGPWADKPIYMGEDLPSQLWAWQATLKTMVQGDVHPRAIYWVYNKGGNVGKSLFCKYMAFHHDVVVLRYGDTKDLLNVVFKAQGKRCYFFDLTRTKPKTMSSEDLYASIESIKDGHFTNTKYETGTVLMRKPHVVVFANDLPNFAALTGDRWRIFTIMDRNLCQYRKRKDPDSHTDVEEEKYPQEKAQRLRGPEPAYYASPDGKQATQMAAQLERPMSPLALEPRSIIDLAQQVCWCCTNDDCDCDCHTVQ